MFHAIVFATTNSGTAARSVVAAERGIKKVGDFRVLSGFDSLNASFHSNWPFGPSYAVLYDHGRGVIYLSSGGAIYVMDTLMNVLAEIRTRGVVWDMAYDEDDYRLYVAVGKAGVQIWDVNDPAAPSELGFGVSIPYARGLFLISKWNRLYIAGGGTVYVVDITNVSAEDLIGSYDIGGSAYTYDLVVHDGIVYVAAGDSGVIALEDNRTSPPTRYTPYANLTTLSYAIDVDYADMREVVNPYSGYAPSPSLIVLTADRIYRYNLHEAGVEDFINFPSNFSPRAIKVEKDRIWVSNANQGDTAYLHLDADMDGIGRHRTYRGGAYALDVAGNQLVLAEANYGGELYRLTYDITSTSGLPWGYVDYWCDSAYYVGDIELRGVMNPPSYIGLHFVQGGYYYQNGSCYHLVTDPSASRLTCLTLGASQAYACWDSSIFVIDMNNPSSWRKVTLGDSLVVQDIVIRGPNVYALTRDVAHNRNKIFRLQPSGDSLVVVDSTIIRDGNSLFVDEEMVQISNRYLYIKESPDFGPSDDSIYIYRLDPDPVYVGAFSPKVGFASPCGVSSYTKVPDFALYGNYLYVAIACTTDVNMDTFYISIYDASHPEWEIPKIVDFMVSANNSLQNTNSRVDVRGNRLYVTAGDTIVAVDISSPFFPKRVARQYLQHTAEYDEAVSSDLEATNRYVYTVHNSRNDMLWDYYKVASIQVDSLPTNGYLMSTYTAWGWTKDVEVYGNYAYLAIEDDNDAALFGGQDLVILDISGTQPTYVSGITLTGKAEGLTVANDTVYMAMGTNGVYAIDVTNKSNPTLINTYNTPGYAYDVYCDCALFGSGLLFIADSSSLYAINHSSFTYHEDYGMPSGAVAVSVATYGGVAYVAMKGGIDGGLLAVDVSGTPFTYLGEYTDTYVLTDAMDVSLDVMNNLAYVAYMDNGMDAIDISDPANMSLQGYWYSPGNKVIGTFYDATGGKVYIANYYDGFVGSAYDPLSGSYYTTSSYTTPSGPRDVWYRNGKVYAASVTAGMQVYSADVATASEERPNRSDGIEVAFGEGGKVMLRGEGEGIEVKIYDASGRLMYSRKVDVRGEEVLRTGLPSGVFMLHLKEGGRSRLLKFVVR